jgi:hypothetical protein
MSELKPPVYTTPERANIPVFDKNGDEIKEFDLIKVFHFTGARRKKHYTYKHIVKNDKGWLICKHLNKSDSSFMYMCLRGIDANHIEIIQRGE